MEINNNTDLSVVDQNYEELLLLIKQIGHGYDGVLRSIRIVSPDEVEVVITVQYNVEESRISWVDIHFFISQISNYKLFKKDNYSFAVLSPYGIQVSYHAPYLYLDFAPYEDKPVRLEYTLNSCFYFRCRSVRWEIEPYTDNKRIRQPEVDPVRKYQELHSFCERIYYGRGGIIEDIYIIGDEKAVVTVQVFDKWNDNKTMSVAFCMEGLNEYNASLRKEGWKKEISRFGIRLFCDAPYLYIDFMAGKEEEPVLRSEAKRCGFYYPALFLSSSLYFCCRLVSWSHNEKFVLNKLGTDFADYTDL